MRVKLILNKVIVLALLSTFFSTYSVVSAEAYSISAITENLQSTTGGGSQQTTTSCGSNQVVYGVSSDSYSYDGATMSNVYLNCANLNTAGTATTTSGSSVGPYGTSKGTTSSGDCGLGTSRVVVGARLYKTANSSMAAGVELKCGDLPNGANASFTGNVIGASSSSYETITCGTGTVAIAAYMRTGSILDAFGMSCARISGATQTITFGTLSNKTLGTGTVALSASTTSGLLISYSSANTTICSVSSATLTLKTAGTCTIRADQSGDSNWAAATQVQQAFTISDTLTITTPASGLTGTYNTSYSLAISASGGTTSKYFSVNSGTLPAGLSINNGTGAISGTPTSPGSATITLRVLDSNTATATTSSFTITINKASQSAITSVTLSATSKSYPYTQSLSATSVSGGSGTGALSITAISDGTASNCAYSAGSITASASGTCILSVQKASDSNYYAETGTATFTFNRANQSLTLSSLGTSSKSYPYSQSLNATTSGSSGTGAVTYTVSDGTASSCQLSNNTSTAIISSITEGTCLVSASIAQDVNYLTAQSSSLTFTFSKASQMLSFPITNYSKQYGQNLTVAATSAGSGQITYSAGASTACTVDSNTGVVTITASTGTCTISASRAADINYLTANSTNSVSITVSTAPSESVVTIDVGVLYYRIAKNVSVTTNTAGKVTFKANGFLIAGCRNLTVNSSNSYTRVCSYRPTSRGTVIITAEFQPSNTSYDPSTASSGKVFIYNRATKR